MHEDINKLIKKINDNFQFSFSIMSKKQIILKPKNNNYAWQYILFACRLIACGPTKQIGGL